MFTRQDYLSAPRSEADMAHRRYYGQFVTPATIACVVAAIGADRLLASTDPHMNDIPLPHWGIANLPGSGKFAKAGDYYTLSGCVCLAKEAARQWLEAQS